jgi:hypothetical protein
MIVLFIIEIHKAVKFQKDIQYLIKYIIPWTKINYEKNKKENYYKIMQKGSVMVLIQCTLPTYEPRHDKTASALSDQDPCCSLSVSLLVIGLVLGKRTTWFLIKLRGCAGWTGSMLVANALCWFCRDAAHMIYHSIKFQINTYTILFWNATWRLYNLGRKMQEAI